MSNLVLTVNKDDGQKETINLTGNVLYHESFKTKSELNNALGMNGASDEPEYLYWDKEKLGDATHVIVYSNDINDDPWKVQVNQAAHADTNGNYSGVIRGSIIKTTGLNGIAGEIAWCQFKITDSNIFGSDFKYVEDVENLGSSVEGDGVCNTLSFETKNLLTVVPLWTIGFSKNYRSGELVDVSHNRLLGLRVENVSDRKYNVILFQDTTLGNDAYGQDPFV